MGIKMGAAFDSAGAEWEAKDYVKGKGKEPLHCVRCPVQIVHQSAHTRERDDKPHLVPAYFRLLPGGRHADGCKYAVSDEIKSIASESKDIFESLGDGQYRLRLVMIRDALTERSKKPTASEGSEQDQRSGKTYARGKSKLPGYINSAKRVLQLRALCDSSDEIAEHLELVFEGNTVVPWSQFYFEAEDYLDAFNNLKRNTTDHPIAIHGTVIAPRAVAGKWGPTNVLNLVIPKSVADSSNPENGIRVQASIWCENAEWFSGLNEGDEVVVLGMWKATAGAPKPSSSPKYRYKSFTTHKLTVTPVLLAQIAKVPSKSA